MVKANKILIKNLLFPVIGLAVFFAVWGIAAAAYNRPLALASPAETFKSAVALIGTGDFWLRMFSSLMRSLGAYLLSFVLGVVLAFLSTLFGIKKIISPVITIVRAVPTVTVIMLIFLWTTPRITPVAVALLVVFPVVYSSFLITLSAADKDLIETAKVFGCGKMGLIRFVYVPSLKRSIIENTASGLSLSLKLVISAEIIVSTKNSIGLFMKNADRNVETAELFAAALLVALFCIIIEYLIRLPLSRPEFN